MESVSRGKLNSYTLTHGQRNLFNLVILKNPVIRFHEILCRFVRSDLAWISDAYNVRVTLKVFLRDVMFFK